MLTRRSFLVSAGAGAVALGGFAVVARRRPGTVVFAFDTYPTTHTVAAQMLHSRGMAGTAYVDYSKVDKTPHHLSSAQIADLQRLGWEIGAYTVVNMLAAYATPDGELDMAAAAQKLEDIEGGMRELGIAPRTIAAGGRGWNRQLADMARGRFAGVRVANRLGGFETYPIADPCYIDAGGRVSLFGGTTVAESCEDIRGAIACGGLLVEVVHRVGDTGDGSTVPAPVLEGILDFAKSEVDRGRLRVCTMEQALRPPEPPQGLARLAYFT